MYPDSINKISLDGPIIPDIIPEEKKPNEPEIFDENEEYEEDY